MQTLFLADLHLSEETPEITSYFKQFIQYCHDHANNIECIFILGDFFEFWIGDDYQTDYIEDIFNDLNSISKKQQIKCFFMHGNRDFLIAKGPQANFEQQTGFHMIEDPYIIELDGEKIVLSHGDSLCSDDLEYQKIRQMVRNELWQKEILSKTINERIQFALASREHSKENYTENSISDVNQCAVNTLLTEQHSHILIHGHTHRPYTHNFLLSGKAAKRIVLAAWYQQGSFLKYENKQFSNTVLK